MSEDESRDALRRIAAKIFTPNEIRERRQTLTENRPLEGFAWVNSPIPIPVACKTCGAIVAFDLQQHHADWHAGRPTHGGGGE